VGLVFREEEHRGVGKHAEEEEEEEEEEEVRLLRCTRNTQHVEWIAKADTRSESIEIGFWFFWFLCSPPPTLLCACT
jgi:hypothetical protein